MAPPLESTSGHCACDAYLFEERAELLVIWAGAGAYLCGWSQSTAKFFFARVVREFVYAGAVAPCIARLSAARASRHVESSVGSGEFASMMISVDARQQVEM